MSRPLRLGLTGGIGSGKTLVARQLQDLGAAVVDADVIAREVVVPGSPAYDGIVQAFGPGIVRPDGTIDRGALGARIFSDAEARRTLNALTHPHIRRRMAAEAARLSAMPAVHVIVFDIPLLLETTDGRDLDLDGIVVVDAVDDARVARLMARGALSETEARRRVAAQIPLSQKVARADWVIDNNGPPDRTREQVEALWKILQARRRPHE
jgi:dephospho-CoA kinase